MKPITWVEFPSGNRYGTTLHTPQTMESQIEALGFLVQRLDNMVRVVRFVSSEWGEAHAQH